MRTSSIRHSRARGNPGPSQVRRDSRLRGNDVLLVAIVLFALPLFSCTIERESTTILTYASPYSPMHPFSRADQVWMKWVEEQSSGTLRVQPYWAGSILSSAHSMNEIRHGVVDIGLITPIYARGGAHLIRIQAGFYAGLTTFEQQVAMYRCLAEFDPQFGRELDDLIVLAVQGGNLPGIVTRDKPISKLDDLKGLRVRAPVEILAVLKHLCADPVDMPMGEVYSALAKGVLDGVVAPADTLRSLHFAEIAQYFNTISIPRGAYAARAMGEKRWRSLTDEQRELLHRGVAVWERALADELLRADRAGETMGREQGMEFNVLPPEEVERFLDVYNQYAERGAQGAQRFGIDGVKTYRYARRLAMQATQAAGSGDIVCTGE